MKQDLRAIHKRGRDDRPSRSVQQPEILFDPMGNAYRFVRHAGRRSDKRQPGVVTGDLIELAGADTALEGGALLTPREAQVARLLACRATNAEIAAALGTSTHTARNHTRRVLEKLGMTSKLEVRERWCKTGRSGR